MEEKKRKKQKQELFEEFLNFMSKRQKSESQEMEQCSSSSTPPPPPSPSVSSEYWPTEYLNGSFDELSVEENQKLESSGPKEESTNVEEEELTKEILELLGKQDDKAPEKGRRIHHELAQRWEKILSLGLDKEERRSIINKYPPTENVKHLITPKINPEAALALAESARKRDGAIYHKQKQVAAAISALSDVLNEIIKSADTGVVQKISDAIRLFCDFHNSETRNRRNMILASVNKELKSSLQQREPQEFLFGDNLSEGIKNARAVVKASQDLKMKKPKTKYLNYQGPPRTQSQPNLNEFRPTQPSRSSGRARQAATHTSIRPRRSDPSKARRQPQGHNNPRQPSRKWED